MRPVRPRPPLMAAVLLPLIPALLPAPVLAQSTEPSTAAPVLLDKVEVTGSLPAGDYRTDRSRSATRTDTPLLDVPQSVSSISRAQIEDQSLQSLGEALRYVPGVGAAQGEGHRDAPIIRGTTTTADLFVDGVRDDVQYLRDFYNIERVEVLKGPNAMSFGRGGVAGVINRVTRQADGRRVRELELETGSYGHARASVDLGEAYGPAIAARLTGVYEDSDSYRDDVGLERYGLNPTLRLQPGASTSLILGYEYFQDQRTTDRGGPSLDGRPYSYSVSTFFGDPSQSHSAIELNVLSAVLEHRFSEVLSLSSRLSVGDYDKFYANVFASGPVSAGSIPNQAYSSATERRNLFSQTDLVWKTRSGGIGHTVLAGVEIGRQVTDNLRLTGRFADGADPDSNPDTTYSTPVSQPNFRQPLVDFVQGGASDGNNQSIAKTASVYLQDQLSLGEHWLAVAGLRYDRFEVDLLNRRSDATPANHELQGLDGELSPRLGLIYKPLPPVSVYGSYSLSYLPRAGEQLASLSPSNAGLDPEQFRSYELGLKWELKPALSLSSAIYQIDRSNVLLVDPANPSATLLGDGARNRGFEIELAGRLTRAWSLAGGYAYQDAKLVGTANASTAREGATLAQTPRNSVSLWNRYDFTPRWGAGLGLLYRGAQYATTSNAVKLDGYTRVDAGLYYRHNARVRAQLNVENLLDERYAVSAHNDNNILPGAPLSLRAALTLGL